MILDDIIWMYDKNIAMIPTLFYGVIIFLIFGWLAFFIYWRSNPPDARLLWKAARPNFDKVLFWVCDKSKEAWLTAGKMLGKGIYELSKFEVVFLPKTPYIGDYPKEIKDLLGAEEHEITEHNAQDPEKERLIQRLFDGVHRLRRIRVPFYFVYRGQGVALNADTVASLGKKSNPGHDVVGYVGQLLDPAKDIPPALGKRTTDSQLRYIAKTYWDRGREDAEGTASKIMVGMIVFAVVIIGIVFFLWKGGYLGQS